MYPSFTSTNFQPFQLHDSPHQITLDELLHQENFPDDQSNHSVNNIASHQQFASQDLGVDLQSTLMEQWSNNNGDNGFNKPIISSSKRNIKASKSDRHSKINTAHGPRDRRMRLSLEVSKKFFLLQDMLGFDRASKTVEWLLMKSEANIQELTPDHEKSGFLGVCISESSTSKCEILSHEYIDGDQNAKSSSSIKRKERKKSIRRVRKSDYLLRPLAKETREMARKRARERTLEKNSKLISGADYQSSKFRSCLDQTLMDVQDANCLGYSIINQPEQPRSYFHFKQRIVDDNSSSVNIGDWNPSFLFNNQQTGVHPQEHDQFNDFHVFGMRNTHELGQ